MHTGLDHDANYKVDWQVRNSPAMGTPTITGTAQVGKTLTADTSAISDANGLNNATFSYQWLADDADIVEATSSSYTLVDVDQGKTIRVRVSFTDDAGNEETLTSAATVAVAPPPLTATFESVPAEHDGNHLFSFELHFSENFPGRLNYKILRDQAFQVKNGQRKEGGPRGAGREPALDHIGAPRLLCGCGHNPAGDDGLQRDWRGVHPGGPATVEHDHGDGAGAGGEQSGHGRAHHHGHGAGGGDADGRHVGHLGR